MPRFGWEPCLHLFGSQGPISVWVEIFLTSVRKSASQHGQHLCVANHVLNKIKQILSKVLLFFITRRCNPLLSFSPRRCDHPLAREAYLALAASRSGNGDGRRMVAWPTLSEVSPSKIILENMKYRVFFFTGTPLKVISV